MIVTTMSVATRMLKHLRVTSIILAIPFAVPSGGLAKNTRLDELKSRLPLVASMQPEGFTLQAVAEKVAPFLWLSPLEDQWPVGLPSEDEKHLKTYYFSIREVACESECGSLAVDRTLPRDTTLLKVRFFFYFKNDAGANGHTHDLESAEFWLLSQDSVNGVQVFLWKVFGAAHGLSWSTNRADLSRLKGIREPERWPRPFKCADGAPQCFYRPVLLVEHGKHAMSPDLDRNGELMPMTDLNTSQADAWGIRDSLGTNSRVSSELSSLMLHRRDPSSLLAPESAKLNENEKEKPVVRVQKVVNALDTRACKSVNDKGGRYQADSFAPKDGSGKASKKYKNLTKYAKGKSFCGQADPKVDSNPQDADSIAAIQGWQPQNPFSHRFFGGLNLAYRFDRGVGAAIAVPVGISFPFIGGWSVFKFNLPVNSTPLAFGKDGLPPSVDLIFMSAATRKLGWYGGGGWEWKRTRPDFVADKRGVAWEIGFKVRTIEVKGALISGRIGYRFNGVTSVRDQRFVAEAGVGAW